MSEEIKQEDVQPEAQQEEVEAPGGPELTVQDLGALKQIIDVASSRGTFKPNEMAVVGQTYNKLEAFLNAVSSQQAQTPGE